MTLMRPISFQSHHTHTYRSSSSMMAAAATPGGALGLADSTGIGGGAGQLLPLPYGIDVRRTLHFHGWALTYKVCGWMKWKWVGSRGRTQPPPPHTHTYITRPPPHTTITQAFDLHANMKEIWSLNPRPGPFSCFDGMRAISCGWVVIYHVLLWQVNHRWMID